MAKKALTDANLADISRALEYLIADWESMSACDWDKDRARQLRRGIKLIERLAKERIEEDNARDRKRNARKG